MKIYNDFELKDKIKVLKEKKLFEVEVVEYNFFETLKIALS